MLTYLKEVCNVCKKYVSTLWSGRKLAITESSSVLSESKEHTVLQLFFIQLLVLKLLPFWRKSAIFDHRWIFPNKVMCVHCQHITLLPPLSQDQDGSKQIFGNSYRSFRSRALKEKLEGVSPSHHITSSHVCPVLVTLQACRGVS